MSQKPEHLKDEGSRTQVLLAGGAAGLVSRFCIAPLDVIKIRLQLQPHSLSDPLSQRGLTGPIYKGTIGTFRSILREEGITAFWKGNIPAEALYLLYGSLQFTTYHTLSSLLSALPTSSRPPLSIETFLSGATAGGIATTLTYPLDLLRTRFAAQGTEKVYSGLLSSILDIATHEGPRGFFRGLGAAVTQIVPYMGLFFASYEALKTPFADLQLPIGSGDAVAGICASIAAKSAVFPLDTVRKRLQVQGPTREKYVHRNIPSYKGVVDTVRTILRREGARGLYRGLPVSLLKAAPASAMTMWTYERTMSVLRVMSDDSDGEMG